MHERYRDKQASIYIYDDRCTVVVSIKNYTILERNGYDDSWIIDNQKGIIKNGIMMYSYNTPEPPDTIICFIRECKPFLRSASMNDIDTEIKWDTVQVLRLIKKTNYRVAIIKS